MMRETIEEISKELSQSKQIDFKRSFELSKLCSSLLSNENTEKFAREIIIRVLDSWEKIDKTTYSIWNDLVEATGLYPYLSEENIPWQSNLLRLQYHKSKYLNYYLHEEQMELSMQLDSAKSLILSAPTSFGKSLLIEEIVASKKHKNIVVIQPTLALLDETRKKLRKYQDHYKIIISTHQPASDGNNLFLLTPERVVEYENLPKIDFFVIDEFYKLSMDRDDERASVLNYAFYKLLKMTHNFYLLGPNIKEIPKGFEDTYNATFIHSNFSTVAIDVNKLHLVEEDRKEEVLFNLLKSLNEPTLIYCRSPKRANELLEKFVHFCEAEKLVRTKDQLKNLDIIEWIDENIHPDWMLKKGLICSAGIHHGALSRHIGSTMVDYFNKRYIKFLFCTSTLIEGVNTSAKNVVLFDKKKGIKLIDYFDFKNISGRSGRFKEHFIGRIFQFYEEPPSEEIQVDIPFFTQDKAESDLLIQLNPEDIKNKESEVYKLINSLDEDVRKLVQSNKGVPIEGQLKVLDILNKNLKDYHPHMNWKGIPNYNQLAFVLQLAWNNLLKKGESRGAGAFSPKQLAYMTIMYTKTRSMYGLIRYLFDDQYLKKTEPNPQIRIQVAINNAYQLRRHWFEYRLPKLLKTISEIQAFIFNKNNMESGDYRFFASHIENSFLTKNLAVLLEYDLPLSAIQKLRMFIKSDATPDETIMTIKKLDLDKITLLKYEKNKILDSL